MAIAPGTRLGAYEITGSLGAGGMGEVYRALDPRLDRQVAIKVLPESVASDAERLARFEREAKALAALNHPNVATLFGMETVDATASEGDDGLAGAGEIPILVMEIVEGPTLADRIAEGPLRWREAAGLFLQIAQGLEVAHESGIVHRDLKPANVKLGAGDVGDDSRAYAGRVKILDFGLAKAMEVDEASGGSSPGLTQSPTLTLAATMRGEVMGTAGYMSPEQARGSSVDKRADVWAFGVCLYEALTGRDTFGGDTISDRLASVLKEEPDWQRLPADLPRGLVVLLRRCLEKSAGQRLRDIGEARIALASLLDDPAAGVEAAPEGAGLPARPWLVPAAAVGGLSVGALLAWLLAGASGSPDVATTPSSRVVTRFALSEVDGEAFEAIGGLVISPDGRTVVLAGGDDFIRGSAQPLRVRSLDSFDSEARVLEGTEGALYPFFSPDGEWVGYFTGPGGRRTLLRVNIETGSILPISRDPHPGYRADWAADGSIVMGEQRGGLRRVVDGVVEGTRLTDIDEETGEVAHIHPEVLPGGRGVIFTSIAAAGESRIAVVDTSTGEVETLVERGGEARYLRSGHLLFGFEGNLHLVRFDAERMEVIGDPSLVLSGVRTGSLHEAFFDISIDGDLIFLRGGAAAGSFEGTSLVWVSPTGDVEEEIARGNYSGPVWDERGGRWLASTPSGIEVFEAGSPLPVRVETQGNWVGRADFGADDSSVVWNSGATAGSGEILLGEIGGAGAPTRLNAGAQGGWYLSDVDRARGELLFNRTGGGGSDVWVAALGGEARELLATPRHEQGARLSRDGALLAYLVTDETAAVDSGTLWVADYPQLRRQLPVIESVSETAYAWDSEGRLWADDLDRQTMAVVSFEREPQLRVRSVDDAFSGTVRFIVERGFDVADDGRLLMIHATREATGQSGRPSVVLGWAHEQGLFGAASE
jgi:serine/threonine-protein kinase